MRNRGLGGRTNESERLGSSCLHEFVGEEAERYVDFRQKHYKKCNNGSRYIVTLLGCGIGEGIEIQCPACGEKANITDTSAW